MEGVPCPAEGNPNCPYNNRPIGCHESTHHLYYPASRYIGFIAHRFRTLPENQVEMCRHEHETLHRTQPAPERPSDEFMAGYLIASEHKIGISAVKRIRRELRNARRTETR